ncbi:M43 family zinc metalloprotease [Emticicia sp. SJ17W-69]|uniref:Ig-like domain-containing protein n=1 Tax=Emticicia sp. SJ17W-69 TaxID=3421657 RepID=UPI003EBFF7A7
MNKFRLLLLFSIFSLKSYAQTGEISNCGTPTLSEAKEYKAFIEDIAQKVKDKILFNAISIDSVLTIPVKFNIYHIGEPVGIGSNVSEEYIQNQVKNLNDAFRARSEYLILGNDSKIQFVLAQKNYLNITTNGIVRIDASSIPTYVSNGYSMVSNIGALLGNITPIEAESNKSIITINVYWKIIEAGGFASYNGSLFMQTGGSFNFDYWNAAYAHEMGHSLNLIHTFEGDNNNANCPQNNDPLNDGDKVVDTQPHKVGFLSTPNSINQCTGQLVGNLYHNIMSYNAYKNQFTIGQIERMRNFSFLSSTRELLLNSSHLVQMSPQPSLCNLQFVNNYTGYIFVNLQNFFNTNFGYVGNLSLGQNGVSGSSPLKKIPNILKVNKGQLYPLTLQCYGNLGETFNQGRVKIYIDSNQDGAFDENSEIIYSSVSTFNVTDSFILPTTLTERERYRIRIVVSPDQNSTACNLINLTKNNKIYVGSVCDFDIFINPSNCNFSIPPLEISKIAVKKGDFAVLEAKNCLNGEVYWYQDSLRTEFISKGNIFYSKSLFVNSKYYAACNSFGCWGGTNSVEVIVDDNIKGFEIKEKYINQNQTAQLEALGCTGQIKWYNTEIGGLPITSGLQLQTPTLVRNTSYFAECTLPSGFKIKNRAIGKIFVSESSIVVKTNLSISFCTNTPYLFFPIQSTSLSGQFYLKILKNNELIYESTLSSYQNNGVPDKGVYLSNDFDLFKLSSGNYNFIVSNGVTTSNLGSIIISKYLNNYTGSSTSLCPNSSQFIKPKSSSNIYFNNLLDDGLSYQWFKDNISIANGNKDSLLINSTGNYSLQISNNACTSTVNIPVYSSTYVSNILLLTNTSLLEPFYIGENVKIVSSYNSSTATYKWFKNNIEIPNSSKPYYLANSTGNYKVEVNDPNCQLIVSVEKNLQFSTTYKATLTGDSLLDCVNKYSQLGVRLNSGLNLEDLIIEWYRNDQLIRREKIARSESFFSGETEGIYYAKIIGSHFETTTNSIKVRFGNNQRKPKIIVSSFSCNTATLTANGSGFPLSWYRNGSLISSNTYSITVNQIGTYSILSEYSNSECQRNSDDFVINNFNLLKITANKNKLCGNNDYTYLTSEIFLTGFNFQWKKDNIDIPFATYSGYNAQSAGSYTLVASNGICTYTSTPYIITQHFGNSLEISPTSNNIWCGNQTIELKLNYPNLPIDWSKDGISLPDVGRTANIFVKQSGTYTAAVNSNGCIGAASATVNYNHTIVNLVPTSTVQPGQRANLEVQSCNGTVRWYNSQQDEDPVSLGNTFLTPKLFTNTTYFVSCQSNNCVSDRIPATLIVCANNLTLNNTSQSGIYKASNSITISSDLVGGISASAGKNILLLPGFSVGRDEIFEAKIGGCN